jgi:SAM-dependent methyltransferase
LPLPESTAAGIVAGWDQVRLLSRLEHGPSNRLLADVLEAERDRAAQALAPSLERWRGVSERRFATYASGPVQARIRRVMDFVAPGDRVLDVGIGIGYPSCLLMRDTGLSYYCGVDLSRRYVEISRTGIEVNGLAGVPHELDVLDIHDVARDFTARHRPDIVLALEVLEHVADPQRAVQALAAAMDEDARLLFTVPMLGRLEGMWGHLSLFDEARVDDICRRAGLAVRHVEAVHNTWILVLATPGDEPPARAAEPDPLSGCYTFAPTALPDEPAAATTGRVADVAAVDGALSFRVGRGERGGVVVPLGEPEVFRIELTCEDPESLEAVSVTARASGGRRMAWTWTLTPRNRPEPRPTTCVFRNGRPTRHFKPTLAKGSDDVDEVAVELTAGAGATAATIHRVASVTRRDPTRRTAFTPA